MKTPFGEFLYSLRAETGDSEITMAHKFNMSPNTFRWYIHGRKTPYLKNWKKKLIKAYPEIMTNEKLVEAKDAINASQATVTIVINGKHAKQREVIYKFAEASSKLTDEQCEQILKILK